MLQDGRHVVFGTVLEGFDVVKKVRGACTRLAQLALGAQRRSIVLERLPCVQHLPGWRAEPAAAPPIPARQMENSPTSRGDRPVQPIVIRDAGELKA